MDKGSIHPITYSILEIKPWLKERTASSCKAILYRVCQYYKINDPNILTTSRLDIYVRVKRLYCFLTRHYYSEIPLRLIGKPLKLHHATVIHHDRKVKDLIYINDPETIQAIKGVENEMNSNYILNKYKKNVETKGN